MRSNSSRSKIPSGSSRVEHGRLARRLAKKAVDGQFRPPSRQDERIRIREFNPLESVGGDALRPSIGSSRANSLGRETSLL